MAGPSGPSGVDPNPRLFYIGRWTPIRSVLLAGPWTRERRRSADDVLKLSDPAVVPRLPRRGLRQLAAPWVITALRPPGARARQPDRGDPGDRGNEHPDHGGADLPLQRHDDADQELDPHGDGESQGISVVAGVQRDEAEDEGATDDRGEDHRVHRRAALLGPVDVVQIEPERELVEGEPDA